MSFASRRQRAVALDSDGMSGDDSDYVPYDDEEHL